MLLLGWLSLITIFEITKLLLQCCSHLVAFVGSAERIHSGGNGEFPCNCAGNSSSQPSRGLMDGGVLEYYSMLRRASSSFQGSEQRLFRTEHLYRAGRHLTHVL